MQNSEHKAVNHYVGVTERANAPAKRFRAGKKMKAKTKSIFAEPKLYLSIDLIGF